MKKIWSGIGTISLLGMPLISVVACGQANHQAAAIEAQKDVDQVFNAFTQANLVVNAQKEVKAASGSFDVQVLRNLGEYNGVYPGLPLPQGIVMTYQVKQDIALNHSDDLVVTITKNGAESKTFNILIDVTPAPLIDVTSSDIATHNITYTANTKTITIGDNVGEINFDLSSIWEIKNIDWGNNPQNILKIGANAFKEANISTLNLSSLTNLTSIGSEAFNQSNINQLNLTNLSHLTLIGYSAFANSTLSNLSMEGLNNLTEIGNSAFTKAKLTALDLSHLPMLYRIGNKAFDRSILKTLNLQNLTKLEIIGYSAFASAQLEQLNLSDLTHLKSIGSWAFDNSGISSGSLDFSNSPLLESIGKEAFENASLSSLNFTGLNSLNNIGVGAFKKALQGMKLTMRAKEYRALIKSQDGTEGLDNRIAIFGTFGNDIKWIEAKA